MTRLKPQGAKTGAHVRQLTNQIALGHATTQPRVYVVKLAGENDHRKELSGAARMTQDQASNK